MLEKRPIAPTLAAQEITIGRIWETVGRRMTESKQQAPHFYVTMEVDMEEAIRVRQWMNSNRPESHQISLNDIIIKACAIALVKHPMINASYIGENKIQMHDSINIGIAVAVKEGLIAPTIHNCEQKSLSTISEEARDLINRTRNGEIKPEEYSGATFTVTNLGMYGVEEFSAIIVPPQAAILATGAATPQPVVLDGKIDIRNRMRITISADHRVTDGARVAEFMRDLKQALEQPMTLLE
jgi:pyruvate dehydrogenase E2 component (dihydrolipoamide acetyltransferase)